MLMPDFHVTFSVLDVIKLTWHRGSIRASHPSAPVRIPALLRFFLLLCLKAIEKSNQSSGYAKDFANAVSGKGQR